MSNLLHRRCTAIAGDAPAHVVTDDEIGFLAACVAQHALALGRLHHHLAAVRGHDQCDRSGGGQADSASTLAAQMKSLIEIPPTE